MDIINRNFFCLLRHGTFGQAEDLETMSSFKWHRLIQIAEAQQVEAYVGRAFSLLDMTSVQLTKEVSDELTRCSHLPVPDLNSATMNIMQAEPEPSNFYLRFRMKRLIGKDDRSDDPSLETQQLLLIIVHNINHTLTRGISLNGIIEMGRFLRQKGQLVDYVRLESWLHRLGFVRMANLQGSILIHYFHFTMEEIPFMHKEEESAATLTQKSLNNTAHDTAENWHFRMRTNGMVENNSRVLRRNLRRSIRYVRFNPFEATSNFIANFVHSLSEIEE